MLLVVTKRSLGAYLLNWRTEQNLSQEAAAAIFGIERSYWTLLEKNLRVPAPALAERFSVATGCPFRIALGIEKVEEEP